MRLQCLYSVYVLFDYYITPLLLKYIYGQLHSFRISIQTLAALLLQIRELGLKAVRNKMKLEIFTISEISFIREKKAKKQASYMYLCLSVCPSLLLALMYGKVQ